LKKKQVGTPSQATRLLTQRLVYFARLVYLLYSLRAQSEPKDFGMGPPLLDKQSEIELSAIGNGQHQLVSDVIGNGQHQLVSSDVDARLADIELMLKQLLAKREHDTAGEDGVAPLPSEPHVTRAPLAESKNLTR